MQKPVSSTEVCVFILVTILGDHWTVKSHKLVLLLFCIRLQKYQSNTFALKFILTDVVSQFLSSSYNNHRCSSSQRST